MLRRARTSATCVLKLSKRDARWIGAKWLAHPASCRLVQHCKLALWRLPSICTVFNCTILDTPVHRVGILYACDDKSCRGQGTQQALTGVQASMRLLLMPMRCCHIAVGGYRGTPLSLSIRKRWLRASLNAARSNCRSAALFSGLPHAVCGRERSAGSAAGIDAGFGSNLSVEPWSRVRVVQSKGKQMKPVLPQPRNTQQ